MYYTYLEIIKEFNKELTNLINQGWVLIPHDYSKGELHENFIKGNQCKVLELIHKSHDRDDNNEEMRNRGRFILQVSTSQFDHKIKNFNHLNSWDYKKKNCKTDILHRFYNVTPHYDCNYFSDSSEEMMEIGRIQKQRNNLHYDYRNYTTYVFPEAAHKVVLSFMQRQPKCKSIKLKDITRVEKRVYDKHDLVDYDVYAKGRCYTLRKRKI